MVRRLFLLRHAKSSWEDPTLQDEDRPLAARGLRAAEKVARHVRESGIRPDLVLCSSALRTRQTLDRIAPALGRDVEVRIEEALYAAGEELLLGRLRQVPETVQSVMLIGHSPGLQDLAITLIGSGIPVTRLEAKFPTGALVTLAIPRHWAEMNPGEAELVGYVVPKELE